MQGFNQRVAIFGVQASMTSYITQNPQAISLKHELCIFRIVLISKVFTTSYLTTKSSVSACLQEAVVETLRKLATMLWSACMYTDSLWRFCRLTTPSAGGLYRLLYIYLQSFAISQYSFLKTFIVAISQETLWKEQEFKNSNKNITTPWLCFDALCPQQQFDPVRPVLLVGLVWQVSQALPVCWLPLAVWLWVCSLWSN